MKYEIVIDPSDKSVKIMSGDKEFEGDFSFSCYNYIDDKGNKKAYVSMNTGEKTDDNVYVSTYVSFQKDGLELAVVTSETSTEKPTKSIAKIVAESVSQKNLEFVVKASLKK